VRTVRPGTAVSMPLVVGEDDLAAVDGQVVHRLLGTAAIVRHVETVSRWLWRQGLEPGEEGAGVEISVRHHRAVPAGAEVELVATVVESTDRRMVTEVVVRLDGADAATASFTQALVDPGSLPA
jgi:fluoroacetyl-CoA thioesterase